MNRRLLIASLSLRPGGVETQLAGLLPRLSAAGFDVSLALWEDLGGMRTRLPRGLDVASFGKPWTMRRTPRFAWWLRGVAADVRPDLIWAFHPRDIMPCVAVSRSLKPSLRRDAPPALPVVANWVGEASTGRLDPLRRRAIRRLSAVAAVNRAVAREFVAAYDYRSLVSVVRNGIDTEAVAVQAAVSPPHPWFGDGAGPVAVTVSRLVAGKGVDDLLPALAAVRRSVPLRLVVIGDGPQRAALEAQAAALDLASAVDFTGALLNPLPSVAAADLFVFASHSESMPFAILEAMALRTPVVAARFSGGWNELLDDGGTALTAAAGDTAGLAAALSSTLADPAAARTRAIAAAVVVEDRNSEASVAKRYVALLEKVLSR